MEQISPDRRPISVEMIGMDSGYIYVTMIINQYFKSTLTTGKTDFIGYEQFKTLLMILHDAERIDSEKKIIYIL